MSEKQILQGRLREIDLRLAEIEATHAHRPPSSYARQELETERGQVATQRRVTEIKLKELPAPPNAPAIDE